MSATKKYAETPLYIVGASLAVIGGFIGFSLAGYHYYNTNKYFSGTRVEATVTDLYEKVTTTKKNGRTNTSSDYFAKISYNSGANGKIDITLSEVSINSEEYETLDKGDKLSIYYVKEDPKDAANERSLNAQKNSILYEVGGGVAAVVIGGAVVALDRKRQRDSWGPTPKESASQPVGPKHEGTTKGGSELLRYSNKAEGELTVGNADEIEIYTKHIEKQFGPIQHVFHEIVSTDVHIDIYIIAPTPKRNYYIVLTGGMSQKPMTTPPQFKEYEYAELMLCLPPDWKMSDGDWKDDRWYWPIKYMKFLARFPHEYATWLGQGHTIPNGEQYRNYDESTQLNCALVTPPTLFDLDSDCKVALSKEKDVYIHALYFIHEAEAEYKLQEGHKALLQLFKEAKVSELLDPKRPSVV